MPKAIPYGAWPSPITADLVSAQGTLLSEPRYVGDTLYWIESRPADKGRCVLVKRTSDGAVCDVTAAPFSVRSRVHEYGGGAAVIADDTVYFVNDDDQRVYAQSSNDTPVALTPADHCRYADIEYDGMHRRLLAVAETHIGQGVAPVNSLVAINIDTGGVTTVASGADFYSNPRVSPDGSECVWLCWNHPNMPWDGTELWRARLDNNGDVVERAQVVGGEDESIFQPAFSPRGVLHFVSDRNGWWNLYRFNGDVVEALTTKDAEFGRPQWQFNMRTYGFPDAQTVVACYTQDGVWHVAEIDAEGRSRTLRVPYTVIEHLDAANGRVAMLAASPNKAPDIVVMDCLTGITTSLHDTSWSAALNEYISIPVPLSYATRDGSTARALFYAPCHPDAAAPRNERPPLLVKCHGGPTAAADAGLDLKIQYWTSRGFAVLDVNYRGSTGYGRAYRRALYGKWGVIDVTDCLDGALHLADSGKVDAARLGIYGSSAGGYTVLSALTFHDTFAVGASLYGISDLETAMADTHKFESRYGDCLLGPWPESKALYRSRSPGRHAARLNCPVIFYQGLRDKIVPPTQTARMVISLEKRGVPVASVTFRDEAHGFRSSRAIMTTLETQLSFFARVFGFRPAGSPRTAKIHNAHKLAR